MLLTLLVAALGSAPQVEEVPPAVEVPPKWEVYVGAMGGVRPDAGGGAAGILGVNRRLTNWLRPEVLVGLGAWANPGDALTVIRIGARLEWPNDARLKPYLWLAFAHHHETPFAAVARNPVSSLLGLSEDGVVHRSGLDTGLGLSLELPRRKDGQFSGRLGARASLTSMLGAGPPRYVDLTLTLGICF